MPWMPINAQSSGKKIDDPCSVVLWQSDGADVGVATVS